MLLPDENSGHGRRTELHLLDNGKDPGLVVVIPVCSNAQVDLDRVGICLICGCEFEDARGGGDIRRSQDHNVYESDTYPSGGARGMFCHNSGRCRECRVSESSGNYAPAIGR